MFSSAPSRETLRLSGNKINCFPRDLACSKRSDSGERCEVKKAMKSRGGLGREVPLSPLLLPRFYFFALLFTLHRSPPYLNAWNRLLVTIH